MRGVATAIDAVAVVDLASLDPAIVGGGIVLLSAQIDRLLGLRARWLSAFTTRGGHQADGALSIRSWARSRCRMSGAAASEAITTAQHLDACPLTAGALESGEIGYQHASVMAHAARDLPADAVREGEPILLDAARTLDVQGLRELSLYWREAADREVARGDANRMHDQRRLYISQTLGGMFRVDGYLDPEAGATVVTALNALSRPRAQETRTPAQRRADALVELCRRQLDGGQLPTTGGQRPHLWVTASAPTMRAEPGAPGAELRWAGPVLGETARRLACDCACTEVTTDSAGEVQVASAVRKVSVPLRRRLIARDRGCVVDDCDCPPEWTEAHHIVHWQDHGPTEMSNLALVCWGHHRVVHEGGWTMVRRPDGKLEVRPPP